MKKLFKIKVSFVLLTLLLGFFYPPSISLAADGHLDSSFGQGGIVGIDLGGTDNGRAVVTDDQGRIIIAGGSENDSLTDFVILRYNNDGTLDASFGENGKVITDLGGQEDIKSLLIDNNGKILIGGSSTKTISDTNVTKLAMVRYNSDGSFDTSFGTDGISLSEFPDNTSSSVILKTNSSGQILVGTTILNNSNMPRGGFAIFRYTSTGEADTVFGNNGIATLSFYDSSAYEGRDELVDIEIDDQNRILAAGYSSTGPTNSSDFAIARFNANGTIDDTFGIDGKLTTDFFEQNDIARDLEIDSQGRIILAGSIGTSGPIAIGAARYSADGTLDISFGNRGRIILEDSNQLTLYGLAIDELDRVILSAVKTPGTIVARYTNDGILDTSFNNDGVAYTQIGTYMNVAYDVATDVQNRVLTVGFFFPDHSGQLDIAVIRYSDSIPPQPPTIKSFRWANNPLSHGQETVLNVVASSSASVPHLAISRVEYYIDTDSGQGNGILIPSYGYGGWESTMGFDLEIGVYQVGIRALDGSGNWSAISTSHLVVYDPTLTIGVTGKNKKALVPSLANGDVLPGLISATQNDVADYGFTVDYNAGVLNSNNDFQFSYQTGTGCKKQNGTNCHSFLLNATNFDWLVIDQVNNSHSKFQGLATLIIDNVTTTNPFTVEGIDGGRLTPTNNDYFILKVYASGANPLTASPIYQASGYMPEGNGIKVR